jgi:peptidyl-prolyl cis-trans isomerase SurA
MKRSWIQLQLAGIGMVLAGLISTARPEVVDVNGIQAIVHDSVITRQDVREMTAPAERRLLQSYRGQNDIYKGDLRKAEQDYERDLQKAERDSLEVLKERQLILHEFKSAGYDLPEKVIDDEIQRMIRSSYGDRVHLINSLKEQGMTFEKYRERLRDQVIEDAMRHKNIASEIIISPHKVEAYYQEHLETFKLEDQVKLRTIVLNKSPDPTAPQAHKMAEEILAKLADGASFADLALLYSQDAQRRQGAKLFDKSQLRKELADVAFSLKPGQHSEVIETPEACWLLLVEEVQPAHHRPLAEVREQIEKDLQSQERSRLQKQWIGRLHKKTFVLDFF